MHEDISQFKISMHYFIFDDCFEGIEDLYEELDSLFFRDGFIFFKILLKISLIAILKNEVEIICCLFYVI